MVKGIGPKRRKLTVSLWEDDIATLNELFEMTGADTLSEVVRDCIRYRFANAFEDEAKRKRKPKAGG